jgi:peptide-methionine (S)-S-oxide reductase
VTTAHRAAAFVLLALLAAAPRARVNAGGATGKETTMTQTAKTPAASKTNLATFGAGCFWCVEAVFKDLDGVVRVESGYAGGSADNPTYEEVCAGATGHAEVVQITYDPSRVSYEDLLEVFFKTHDPTTSNRQGPDEGTQYRSAILYHDDEQKKLAEKVKRDLDRSGAYEAPIVTEVSPFRKFFKAEDYHQNYFSLNPRKPYCVMVIQPKVEKFRKVFQNKLKKAK